MDVAGDTPYKGRPEGKTQREHGKTSPEPWFELEKHSRAVQPVGPDQEQLMTTRLAGRSWQIQLNPCPVAIALVTAKQEDGTAGGMGRTRRTSHSAFGGALAEGFAIV